ncbi:Uncharacterised protein [Vibrio cholerae]|nr:Uncharacterised protein [Vibrio cholerae]
MKDKLHLRLLLCLAALNHKPAASTSQQRMKN